MLVAEWEHRVPAEQLAEKPVLTASEAGQLLGIGHSKLAQLLNIWEQTGKQGVPFERSKLDHRVLLIKRSDVVALLEQSRGMTVEQARHQLGVSRAKMKELIEAGELPVRHNPLHKRQRIVDPERYEALLAERNIRSVRRQTVKEESS